MRVESDGRRGAVAHGGMQHKASPAARSDAQAWDQWQVSFSSNPVPVVLRGLSGCSLRPLLCNCLDQEISTTT
jgi:hypothetical protein